MNNEIKIPDVIIDIPDYPNWKKGRLWGLVLTIPFFIVLVYLSTVTGSKDRRSPNPVWYEEVSKNIAPSLILSSAVFMIIFSIVAFKPIRDKKLKDSKAVSAGGDHSSG
jgi:hypothetical protein